MKVYKNIEEKDIQKKIYQKEKDNVCIKK